MAMPNTQGPERINANRPRSRLGDSRDLAFVVVHETARGTVAWVRGDLDVSTAPTLLRQLIDTLDLPLDRLVVDLAEVRDIDAHGRATLQVAQKRARMRGVELTFEGLDGSVELGPAYDPT
jgi:anti-anti-sigma regulatory factor